MKIEEHVPLSRLTSLHVGGPARYVAHISNQEDMAEALALAQREQLPFFVLGKGSNTLFSDKGYPGVIFLMANRQFSIEGTTIRAGAGLFMRLLVTKALDAHLRGLEELAGIPGTVGGAVRGNAGTWQTEIKDVVKEILVWRPDETGTYQLLTMKSDQCGFGYRHSIFKQHPDWIVWEVVFQMKEGVASDGQVLVAKDLHDRHTKQPYDAPSAGSVFKNPDKAGGIFSGKLIEAAGLKGYRVGGAEISPKHGNFIVNRGGASAQDILQLIETAQKKVKEQFGVDLTPEIEIVDSN